MDNNTPNQTVCPPVSSDEYEFYKVRDACCASCGQDMDQDGWVCRDCERDG
jgi:predicted amidophosphoribosyltransferase